MRKSLLAVILVAPMVFNACGQDKVPENQPAPFVQPAVVESLPEVKKVEPPRYVYRGDKYRDPYIPLTGEGLVMPASEELQIPNLSALSLKGLFVDGKHKLAIINAGAISYMLKGNLLYDNRQRLIRGMTGIIKADRVLITAPDKTTKELKLREKP